MAEETSFLRFTLRETQDAGIMYHEPETCRRGNFEPWERTELECCTFVHVVQGEVLCRVNEILFVLRENHTIVMYPEASLLLETISKHAELLWIDVQGQRMKRYVQQAGIPFQGCIAESDGSDRIRFSFLNVMELYKGQVGIQPAFPGYLFMLLSGAAGNKVTPIPNLEDQGVSPHLRSAIRYASANLSDPELSVSLLADAIGISRSLICSPLSRQV